jgi:lipopolysaccharide heptosyltransferase I
MPLPSRVLIVRLSALGDIVHAVPVLAALRHQDPAVEVDWLVEEAYAPILALVDGLRRRVVVRAEREPSVFPDPSPASPRFSSGASGYLRAVAFLRRQRYDVALDLQGLIKSAVWARASGARRVVGFAREHLREPQAAWLYHEHVTPPHPAHVIQKNLAVARHLGAAPAPAILPLRSDRTPALTTAMHGLLEGTRYAVINPGAAWPNKRWPGARFAALCRALFHEHGLVSVVTWGPAERALADEIVALAAGAARLSPPTSVGELAAVLQDAALVVSGDTGPLHIAAAVGAPVVGLYGPTWPERNGPWDPGDEVISRADRCQCHHKRQCLIGAPCIESISLEEVLAAAGRRIEGQKAQGRGHKAEGGRQEAERIRQDAEGLP